MKASEIIANDPETQKVGAAKVLAGISKLTQSGRAILLQRGDTVLLLISISEGVAELHLYSVDSPPAVASAVKFFQEKIKSSDLKRVYGSKAPPEVMRLIQMVGIPAVKSDKPNYTWMANV